MRAVRRIIFSLLGLWLLLCGLMYVFQRRLQYFPDKGPVGMPPGLGIEDVTLEGADGVKTKAWYWPGRRDLVLLIFHGNAGHRGHRLGWIEGFHARGWGVMIPDYRGYGGSEGSPSEQKMHEDADVALDFLKERRVKRVVVFGRSLGSGVAVALAARRAPAGLIVENGALSFADMAQNAYPLFPVRRLMKDPFDNRANAKRLTCPGLYIHAEHDDVVATRFGRALYDAAGGRKEWWLLRNANHNDIGGSAYYEKINTWLESLGAGR